MYILITRSKEEAGNIVRDRAPTTGAIPRYSICKRDIFIERHVLMRQLASKALSHDLRNLSFQHIPEHAQYLVVPLYRHGATNPRTRMSIVMPPLIP